MHELTPSDGVDDPPLGIVSKLSGRRFALFICAAHESATREPVCSPRLRRAYSEFTGERLSDGGFYSSLESLVDAGLLESGPNSGRQRTWYVSDLGWEVLAWGCRVVEDSFRAKSSGVTAE